MKKLAIYVFSYNRARFLQHCLRTVEECCPGFTICIVDDDSTDLETVTLLKRLSVSYEVISNGDKNQAEHKTGGLAGCMNTAMLHARENEVRSALFIQDDMQMVRKLLPEDFQRITDYFQRVPNTIQVSSTFVRLLSAEQFLGKHSVKLDAHAYIRQKWEERGKSSFSATGVFDVERFHRLYSSFEVGEGNNSDKARRLGLVCGRSIYPFMCWLPYPESYRGKRKDMKHKFFEYFGRSGFYPIELMSDESVAELFNRDPHTLPIMERYLSAPTSPRADIWSTGGGEYNFAAYGSFAAKIYKFLRYGKRTAKHLVGK